MRNPAELRAELDLGSLLEELGVEAEHRSGEHWFRCRSGLHPDRTPSCAIRDEPGMERHGFVYCQSCKWSTDVYGLIMAVRHCSFPAALNFAERHRGQNLLDGAEEDESIYRRLLKPGGPPEIEPPEGLAPIEITSAAGSCYRYLAKRGFSWREVEQFGLRDWQAEGRLFVPVTRRGRLISWVARSYRDGKPKVLTPPGCAGARWAMVNFDGLAWKQGGEVHLTEGWASCFRVWQAGFGEVVATCGSRLKQEQALDLAWTGRIVHWQEGDHAGEAFFVEVLGWLGRGRQVEVVRLPEGTDPADYGVREIRALYEQRTIWSTNGGREWQSSSSTGRQLCSMRR